MHSARRFVQVVLERFFLQIVQMLQLYVVSHPVRSVSKGTNLRMSQSNQHTCPLVQDASEKLSGVIMTCHQTSMCFLLHCFFRKAFVGL